MIKKYFTAIVISAATLLYANESYAQRDTTLRREVEVVKAFSPTAVDAEKINEMPVIKDDVPKKPSFDYSIISQPVFSTLSVTNLQAANILGQPKENPGLGLLRLGAGNYNKPYGEFFFNNNNAKNSVFGLHLKHLSSHSKLRLEGGDRVNAPFSDNMAEMFLKHMFRNSTLSVNLGVNHNGFNYYGYPVDSIPGYMDTLTPLTNLGNRQTFTKGGININLKNIETSKSDPSAGFDFSYYHFGAKTGQREHLANFTLNFRKPFDPVVLLLEGGAEYSQTSGVWLDSTNTISRKQTWLFAKPALFIGNETINLKAGFKTWLVFGSYDKTAYKIAPDVRFNFAPVKEIINVFAGIDGNYHHNHYSAIAYQNPFIDPVQNVKNHLERYRFYGGFDGKFSSNTNFKIEVAHSTFDGHPFYYLQSFAIPTMGPLPGPEYADNTFKVLYDDMQVLRFNAEITHSLTDKLNLLITGNYYKYTLNEQTSAWFMPQFDATLALSYKVTDRLSVAADVYVTGQREAFILQFFAPHGVAPIDYEQTRLLSSLIKKTYTMKSIADLNFRGTYDISRKLAVFAQLNNFGFQKYEKWLGYPVQTFNFLGGLALSF